MAAGLPKVEPYRRRGPRDPAATSLLPLERSLANGEERDVELSGATLTAVDHSLGRAYRGALVVAQDMAVIVAIEHPDSTTLVDPAKQVSIGFSAPFTGRLRLWIY